MPRFREPPKPSGREGTARSADYEHLRRDLARAVGRVCPGWLADAREDIVQNALTRILATLSSDEHSAPPSSSYVWKVAYTATIDEIRRAQRRREVALGPITPDLHSSSASGDPSREQESRELGAGIQGCLGRLIEDRRLVVGFHLLGHTVAEIEDLLGWNKKKVRNLLYRGLADLRRCLQARGFSP